MMDRETEMRRGIDGVTFSQRRIPVGWQPAQTLERELGGEPGTTLYVALQHLLDGEGMDRRVESLRLYRLENGWVGWEDGLQEFLTFKWLPESRSWDSRNSGDMSAEELEESGLGRVDDVRYTIYVREDDGGNPPIIRSYVDAADLQRCCALDEEEVGILLEEGYYSGGDELTLVSAEELREEAAELLTIAEKIEKGEPL